MWELLKLAIILQSTSEWTLSLTYTVACESITRTKAQTLVIFLGECLPSEVKKNRRKIERNIYNDEQVQLSVWQQSPQPMFSPWQCGGVQSQPVLVQCTVLAPINLNPEGHEKVQQSPIFITLSPCPCIQLVLPYCISSNSWHVSTVCKNFTFHFHVNMHNV